MALVQEEMFSFLLSHEISLFATTCMHSRKTPVPSFFLQLANMVNSRKAANLHLASSNNLLICLPFVIGLRALEAFFINGSLQLK